MERALLFLVLILVLPLLAFAEEPKSNEKESAAEETNSGGASSEYFKQLSDTYRQMRDSSGNNAGEAYKWAKKDLKNINAFEYKIVSIPLKDSQAAEKRLNELGADRWESVQAVPLGDKMTFIFKRRRLSYLKHLPVKDLLRMLSGEDDNGQ